MKDNVSIIFAAIIGVLLIVILPLFSILDRQDSMSYNVVLTQTTKFVDNIRNNGFIDKESYYNYISALTSTSNTYKVEMEIYRKRLIPDVDAGPDTYIEEVELFNTQDVLEVIESENSVSNANTSNEKNNVYLLKENDEVYFKVYNTNITAGSILYNALANTYVDKVIDITYGGVVNNINWELFDKINATSIDMPQVLMEVPVNAVNETNIMKVTDSGELEEIDCNRFYELCNDGYTESQADEYTYYYDLSYTDNKQMTIAVELKNVDFIAIGEMVNGELVLARLETLTTSQFNSAKNYIKNNFIQLNEMIADVDLEYRGKQENGYYEFNIILSDIKVASYGLMSVFASVSILPGLGQDVDGTISMGAESVKVELVDVMSVHSVTISEAIHFGKFKKTGRINSSLIQDKRIYLNQEVAFIISYTGITDNITDEGIKATVTDNLEIYGSQYGDLEILTAAEVKNKYNIDLNTRTVGHVLVKFKYINLPILNADHYIEIKEGWIQTNANNDDDYIDDNYVPESTMGLGAESTRYNIWTDNVAPYTPQIVFDGIIGNNGWYTSDVNINLIESQTDTAVGQMNYIYKGVGVDKNTLKVTHNDSVLHHSEEDLDYMLTKEGTSIVYGQACDYVNNCTDETMTKREIKLDKTSPIMPTITIIGRKGANDWYTSNVTINISNIKDDLSGVDKVTYKLNNNSERTISGSTIEQQYIITIDKAGANTLTIIIYDKAGNACKITRSIKIDKTTPAGVNVDIDGNVNQNGWYNTDVTITLSKLTETSPSGTQKIEYEIKGPLPIPTTELKENIKEIVLGGADGTYELYVRSYNNAGAVTIVTKTIKIDKTAPTEYEIYHSVVANEYGWNNTPLTVKYSNSTDATSGVNTRAAWLNDTQLQQIFFSGGNMSYSVSEEGIYNFEVLTQDNAGNTIITKDTVKVDMTPPTSPEFVISGVQGLNNWYTSDVDISYKGGSDNLSGVKRVNLSTTKLTTDSPDSFGTEVDIITEDYAGNLIMEMTYIQVDKTIPTKSVISIPTVTGVGPAGVNLYNKDVDITITPGTDKFLNRSTYKITGDKEVSETRIAMATNYSFTENGKYEVIAYTYDDAGNKSTSSTVIWINKDKPQSPKLSTINETTITNSAAQTVTGTNNKLALQFANVEVGSSLKVKLVSSTYETREVIVSVSQENQEVTIDLDAKGVYAITATQTNMFGTTSDISSGVYYYQYK